MSRLEQAWYAERPTWWLWLLLPLMLLFWAVSSIKRNLYRLGIKQPKRSHLPVVVVGNITVGGTGKTPFVIYLAELLKQLGYTPAIVSRGYGAKTKGGPVFPRLVNKISDPSLTGDEPNLIALRTGCPVIIDADRSAAVKYASRISGVDIVISDDGLQHYKMHRDLEITLIDGARLFGNEMLLPMGPLREPLSRLQSVNVSVVNSGFVAPEQVVDELQYDYRLKANELKSLTNEQVVSPEKFNKKAILVSGIGNPQRFRNTVEQLGIDIAETFWYPDHHNFSEQDFALANNFDANEYFILMTEKDAVKCKAFAKEHWYYLPISAAISSSLEELLKTKIDSLRVEK